MNLADWQIAELCKEYGMIEPFDPRALNAYGYDVGLSGHIWKLSTAWTAPLDPFDPPPAEAWEEYELGPHTEFIVDFGDLVLARSVEKFRLPNYVTLTMNNRSKFCRCGATPNAGLAPGDAGWHGYFVFELNCLQRNGTIYRVGTRIAQARFSTGVPCNTPYDDNHVYQGQSGIMGPMAAKAKQE